MTTDDRAEQEVARYIHDMTDVGKIMAATMASSIMKIIAKEKPRDGVDFVTTIDGRRLPVRRKPAA